MVIAKVVRKGSYQGVPQWGISTSSEITPSKKTAQKWAAIENASHKPVTCATSENVLETVNRSNALGGANEMTKPIARLYKVVGELMHPDTRAIEYIIDSPLGAMSVTMESSIGQGEHNRRVNIMLEALESSEATI